MDQVTYRKDALETELGEVIDQLDDLKIKIQKMIITLRVLKEIELGARPYQKDMDV